MTWAVEHELVADATPAAVWELWADPRRWREWNSEVVSARVDEPLAPGSRYTVRFRRGMPLRCRVIAFAHEREFTDEGRLPGARMGHQRVIAPVDGGVAIRNRVYLSGPFAFVYRTILGRRLERGVRDFVARERALAENAAASR